MKIVIDIPDELYNSILNETYCGNLYKELKNGIVLPKGHGRLIDADEALKAIETWDKFGYTETGCFVREPKNDYVPYIHYDDVVTSITNTPTIIPSDKEESK